MPWTTSFQNAATEREGTLLMSASILEEVDDAPFIRERQNPSLFPIHLN